MSVQDSLEFWTAHFLVQWLRKLSNTTFGPFSCLSSLSYQSSALCPHLNELVGVHWIDHTITYHCPCESIISNTGNPISHKAYSSQKSHLQQFSIKPICLTLNLVALLKDDTANVYTSTRPLQTPVAFSLFFSN